MNIIFFLNSKTINLKKKGKKKKKKKKFPDKASGELSLVVTANVACFYLIHTLYRCGLKSLYIIISQSLCIFFPPSFFFVLFFPLTTIVI